MATEWYLMTSPHDQLSGFEGEALADFGKEGFEEVLESELAVDVEVCNYDLSDCKPMKAIVENNTQDTKLKSLVRNILLPIGTAKAGMYIKYKDRYWLITGIVDDNQVYEKCIANICNWNLTWVGTHGQIVQRWANIVSASQYNNGETGVKYYVVRSDQLLISIPDDDESILIKDGQRFIIDRRTKIYEKKLKSNISVDTSYDVLSYQLTRADTILYDYQDSGNMTFIATQDEQHENDGYYMVDGFGYWLCDNPIITNQNALSSEIIGEEDFIYAGMDETFSAVFTDENGDRLTSIPSGFAWRVDCDFMDDITIVEADNSINISVNNQKLANKKIVLYLNADGYEEVSKEVYIKRFL